MPQQHSTPHPIQYPQAPTPEPQPGAGPSGYQAQPAKPGAGPSGFQAPRALPLGNLVSPLLGYSPPLSKQLYVLHINRHVYEGVI